MKRTILALILAASSVAAHAGDTLKVLADATKTPNWGLFVEYTEQFSKDAYVFPDEHNPADFSYNAPQIKKWYKPAEIYRDFKDNEIKAKHKYGDQPFAVSLTIKSIGLDALGHTRLEAGVDQFHSVFFKDIAEEDLIDLKAGEKVGLVCKGGEFAAIIPIIHECITMDRMVKEIPSNIPANITSDNVVANAQTWITLINFIALRNAVGAEKFDKLDRKGIDQVWSDFALRPKSKTAIKAVAAAKRLLDSFTPEQQAEIQRQGKLNAPEFFTKQ